ncbi:MAG: GTP-dependent dephospho-CoA kinase family protein [Candidatus Bathyarchaeia archaeon]
MRGELKRPLGLLLEGEPGETVPRLAEMIRSLRPTMFASVGDSSTENILTAGLEPDIVVVDHRIMRVSVEPIDLGGRVEIPVRNLPGTIDADAWRGLREAVTLKKGVAVIVEGEEDLLVLPLIALMPLGSVIVYGQPQAGMVVVEVTEERKMWAEDFMKRMEEG